MFGVLPTGEQCSEQHPKRIKDPHPQSLANLSTFDDISNPKGLFGSSSASVSIRGKVSKPKEPPVLRWFPLGIWPKLNLTH